MLACGPKPEIQQPRERLNANVIADNLAIQESFIKTAASSIGINLYTPDKGKQSFSATLYNDEEKYGKIFMYFSILAILIGCLGLFGLASFMSKQRTKEIGIRKVLGSTLSSIIGLLSKEFLILTAIACFIACPISFFYMNKWLQNFAYRTPVEMWVYLLAGLLALSITLITISFQTIRMALVNPIESLKYE